MPCRFFRFVRPMNRNGCSTVRRFGVGEYDGSRVDVSILMFAHLSQNLGHQERLYRNGGLRTSTNRSHRSAVETEQGNHCIFHPINDIPVGVEGTNIFEV